MASVDYQIRVITDADFSTPQVIRELQIVPDGKPCYGIRVVWCDMPLLGIRFSQPGQNQKTYPLRQGQFFRFPNPHTGGVFVNALADGHPSNPNAIDNTLFLMLAIYADAFGALEEQTDNLWDVALRCHARQQYTPAVGATPAIAFALLRPAAAPPAPSTNDPLTNRMVKIQGLHVRSSLAGLLSVAPLGNFPGATWTDTGTLGISRRFNSTMPSSLLKLTADNQVVGLAAWSRDFFVAANQDVFLAAPFMDWDLLWGKDAVGPSGMVVYHNAVNAVLTAVLDYLELPIDYNIKKV